MLGAVAGAAVMTGAAHRDVVISGRYPDLARQGKVPDLAGDPAAGSALGQATVQGVSPQWEDIGLGAITDIVQHAFGPVDLDGSPVELRMAGSRPGCPACAGKRFHFPAELAEARDRMCPAYRAEAEAVITHRLGRAAASNRDGWRALGGASRRLEQPHLPNGLATKLAGAATAMHVIRSRQSTQLGLHIEHATAVSRPAGAKPVNRFHRARYGEAGCCTYRASTRHTASMTSSGSRPSSICRPSVARLSARAVIPIPGFSCCHVTQNPLPGRWPARAPRAG